PSTGEWFKSRGVDVARLEALAEGGANVNDLKITKNDIAAVIRGLAGLELSRYLNEKNGKEYSSWVANAWSVLQQVYGFDKDAGQKRSLADQAAILDTRFGKDAGYLNALVLLFFERASAAGPSGGKLDVSSDRPPNGRVRAARDFEKALVRTA